MTADTMSNGEVSTSMLNAYKEIDASYITIEGLATQTNETKVSLYNIFAEKYYYYQTITWVHKRSQQLDCLLVYVIELESGSDRLTKKLLIQ